MITMIFKWWEWFWAGNNRVEEQEKDEETDSDDVIIELLFTTVCTKNH
jgi:hypothetical protein